MDQPRWGSTEPGADARALCAFSSGDDANKAVYVAFQSSASGSEDGAIESTDDVVEIVPNPLEDKSVDTEDGSVAGEGADHTPVGRYFLPQGGDCVRTTGAKCFSCGQRGHMSRDCPVKATLPCFLCGGTDHQRSDCPDDICFNCGCVGHFLRECREPRRRRPAPTDECMRCGELGHLRRECSLAWRRYVLVSPDTLTEASLARALRPIARACYYCASSTHFGDDCPLRLDTAERTAFRRPNVHVLAMAAITDSAEDPPRAETHVRRGQSTRPSVREPDMGAAERRALGQYERALGHAGPAHSDYAAPGRGAMRGKAQSKGHSEPRGGAFHTQSTHEGAHGEEGSHGERSGRGGRGKRGGRGGSRGRGAHRQTYPNMSYRRSDA